MLRPDLQTWKWALWGALAMTLLSLYPQSVMWATRGREWNGTYAQVHGDEWLYSAYVEALIDGRPRRNDSYTGRDDGPGGLQPESVFSIQCVPAYLIAIPARILGISSSTAFIIQGILTPFLSSLAIFWLLLLLTDDARIAAAGSVVVLCFGALAGGQGIIQRLVAGSQYFYLPFLRRYEPATMFPLFFVFCGLVWKSLSDKTRRPVEWAAAAGLSLGVLVFSYFYLWTAAVAWLVSLAVVWFAARHDLKRSLQAFATIFVFFIGAFVPYMILLSRRSMTMDSGQKLNLSHAPDLVRAPELVGLAVIALIIFAALWRTINWRKPEVLFAASFGLMPLVVFNQQLITGRSLQPYHYSLFIANYVSLVGAVLAIVIVWMGRRENGVPLRYRRVGRVVVLALWWAAVELIVHTRVMVRESAFRDRTAAVCQRLGQLGREEDRAAFQIVGKDPRPLVMAGDDDLAIMIPTFAPQALLWAHNFAFLNLDPGENQERFYQYLYYSGIDAQALAQDLAKPRSRFGTAVFGHERVIKYLSTAESKPITADEITEQVKKYESYINSFTRETATRHPLSYLIYPVKRKPDLTNLDRWYVRDNGEQVDAYLLYRLHLRP